MSVSQTAEASKVGRRLSVPAGVATRVYAPIGREQRAIILNNVTKELLTLDGGSAVLWGHIAFPKQGSEVTESSLALTMRVTVAEMRDFIDELYQLHLIAIDGRTCSSIGEFIPESAMQIIPKLSTDGNTESAPGGSNLPVELEFQEWASDFGFLWAFTWELTYRCNESCIHCFNPGAGHSEGEKQDRKTDELSTQECLDLLDELASLGVFRLLFTGGEIFLRKDIFTILDRAFELRFAVTLYTNGVLLQPDHVKYLAKNQPSRVELSLYSHNEGLHDSVTRLKASWRKTVSIAESLRDAGVMTSLKFIGMRENTSEFEAFLNFADRIGIPAIGDFNLSSGVDGSQYPLLNLSPMPLDLINQALNPRSPLFVGEEDEPLRYEPKNLIGQRVCGAGVAGMAISPEGNIYPCNSLPIYVGSIRDASLSDVWRQSIVGRNRTSETPAPLKEKKPLALNDRLSKWQEVKRGDYEVCGTFNRCGWCQKCPGMAFLETGSELKPSSTNCRNAAARMIAYDLLKAGVSKASSELLDQLKNSYPNENALWDQAEVIEHSIPLEDLRKELALKTRTTSGLKKFHGNVK